jgi:signal transduction histidine kinase
VDRSPTPGRWPAYATVGAYVVSVLLPVVELTRIAVFEPAEHAWIALVATALYLPLHLRHVGFALGRRSAPAGGWSLAAVAVITLTAYALIGPAWSFALASLVVSTAIVLRPRWSIPAAAAIILLVHVVGLTHAGETARLFSQGLYLAISVAFRSAILLVTIWLVAAVRELHATREALAEQAVASQRAETEATLGGTLLRGLEALASVSRDAERHTADHDPEARRVLTDLAAASRERLDETRRFVAGHRGAVDRRRLEAVATLLRGDGGSREAVAVAADRVAGADALGPSAGVADGVVAPGSPAVPTRSVRARAADRWGRAVDAARARTSPVDAALGVARRSRWLLVVLQLPMFAYLLTISTIGFENGGETAPWLAGPVVVLCALQLWLSLSAASGERPHGAWVALAAMLGIGVLGTVAIGTQFIAALWMIGGAIGVLTTGRVRAVLIVVVIVGQVVPNVVLFLDFFRDAKHVSWYLLYIVTISSLAPLALIGAVGLCRTTVALARSRAELAEQAVDVERRRLSRDLHDALGQSLSAISLKGDLALALLDRDPDAAATEARGIREVAERLADDVRAVVSGGRPVSFVVEVAGAVDLLRAAGVDAEVDVDLGPLTTEADALFGWAVREGTTNVLRHSRAERCVISAVRDDGRFGLEVVNDGAADPAGTSGSGLDGLADRARTLRGVVTADRDGGSFRLRVLLPEEAS